MRARRLDRLASRGRSRIVQAMSFHRLRALIIVLTILGLVAPRISAAVAVAAPGMQTIVICTGDGLQTIRIGDDGKPVPVADHSHQCVLSHAADTAMRVEPAPVGLVFERVPVAVSGDLIRAHLLHAPQPPPRAPPAA